MSKRKWNKIWGEVRGIYESGFCVSERGLQAALYENLSKTYPEKGVVVEPTWGTHPNYKYPDIVMVEDNEITDIFELKFKPHGCPEFHEDIEKLERYSDSILAKLDPATGKWEDELPIARDCRLHFVVVGRSDAEAVYPNVISSKIWLWYGRISEQQFEWGICQGEQNPDD